MEAQDILIMVGSNTPVQHVMVLRDVNGVVAIKPKNAQSVMATAIALNAVATGSVPIVMVIPFARAATVILFARAATVRLSARAATVRLSARPVTVMATVLIARTATANVRRARGRARSHFHR